MFSLAFQGEISVNGILNREDIAVYYLLITATDNGLPPRLGQAYVSPNHCEFLKN